MIAFCKLYSEKSLTLDNPIICAFVAQPTNLGMEKRTHIFIHPCVINKKVRKIMYWLSLPNGAMGLNLWGSLTSKLDGYPIDLNPSPAGPSQSMKKIATA